MPKRIIEVERCSPADCPYCKRGFIWQKQRYCEHGTGVAMRPVKTFPKFCPLKRAAKG